MYDPAKKEYWIIGGQGFWRDGDINLTQHMTRRYCTWQEAKDLYKAIIELSRAQHEALRTLEETNREEMKALLGR